MQPLDRGRSPDRRTRRFGSNPRCISEAVTRRSVIRPPRRQGDGELRRDQCRARGRSAGRRQDPRRWARRGQPVRDRAPDAAGGGGGEFAAAAQCAAVPRLGSGARARRVALRAGIRCRRPAVTWCCAGLSLRRGRRERGASSARRSRSRRASRRESTGRGIPCGQAKAVGRCLHPLDFTPRRIRAAIAREGSAPRSARRRRYRPDARALDPPIHGSRDRVPGRRGGRGGAAASERAPRGRKRDVRRLRAIAGPETADGCCR